jgi:hypothetical protein
MGNLLFKRSTLILLVLFILSSILTSQSLIVGVDPSSINITTVHAVNNNGQRGLFFVRGVDAVGFNITIANNGLVNLTGIIILTIQDVNGVPIQTLTRPNISVNAGETSNFTVASDKIPSWAYVGIATAQISFLDSQTSIALCPSATAKFYISLVSNPINPFGTLTSTLTNSSITAGDRINCSATAYDVVGNSIDVTFFTNWTASNGGHGAWIANTYLSAKAGVWNITATIANLSSISFLIVSHASPVSIAVSPQNAQVTAGQSQPFAASAFDAYSNSWDVTNSTVFTLNLAAGGSWQGNTYQSARAGNWNVSGTFGSLLDATILTVNHGEAINLTISPKECDTNSGLSQIYESSGYDFYGNSWDTTNLTSFKIDIAAGGSWVSNNYTSGKIGNWTITASYNGFTDFSNLTVYNTVDLNRDDRVNFRDIQYFVPAYVNFSKTGILDSACDLNHDRTLNFNDIKFFASYYITYWSS